MNGIFERDLHEQLERLPLEAQRRVLEFARSLESEYSGAALLRLAGTLSPEEASAMQRDIDQEFGRVDLNDW
jgi:hypothetical protein